MGRYARDGGSYRSGGSYADGGSYDGGGSYAEEGISPRGSGESYRRGYSRAEGKEAMMEKLEHMMENAENVRQREALQKCLRTLETM